MADYIYLAKDKIRQCEMYKIWGRLVNPIVVGIIYGFRILIFTIEKIVFLSRRIIERFWKQLSK